MLVQLDINALALGTSWLMLGMNNLDVLTRGFRTNPPEAVVEVVEKVEATSPPVP